MRGRKLENFEDFNRALKNKYGISESTDYKPWVRVQDVSGEGVRSQLKGITINRTHHFLSSIETELFYISDFSDSVIDIREQFPLIPIDLSLRIAKALNVEHPKHPKSNTPIVMTTDVLLTRQVDGEILYEAISVKPKTELSNQRVCEKLEIERIWWELLGVNFKIYTGDANTRIQSENIKWATQGVRSSTSSFEQAVVNEAQSLLKLGKNSIAQLCDAFNANFDIKRDQGLELLRYLIGSKKVDVDLTRDITNADIIDVLNINRAYSIEIASDS